MEIRTRPHSRRWRRVRSWLAGSAVALAIGLLAPAALGLSPRSVADDAMAGTVPRGSLAFERPVSKVEQLRVGDVISFPSPQTRSPGTLMTRRVVAIEGGAVRTRGDALPTSDPWAVSGDGAELTRVVFAIPLAGYPQLLVPWLSWAVVALLVALAAVAASVAARREARGQDGRPIRTATPGAVA